jgi:hypothetical protein
MLALRLPDNKKAQTQLSLPSSSCQRDRETQPAKEARGLPYRLRGTRGQCSLATMTNETVKHIWNRGLHWAIKKNTDRYWYRGKDDVEWKCGLPPGVTVQEADRAFREPEGHVKRVEKRDQSGNS